MVLFSHPANNPYVRNAALGLLEAGLLEEFWTCFSWAPGASVNRLLPRGVSAELSRRSLPAAVQARTHDVWPRELARLFAGRLGWEPLYRHETGFLSVDAVLRDLDRAVARRLLSRTRVKPRAVYTNEDSSVKTLAAARELGIAGIYDLPIGYWRAGKAIYEEERVREPEWASTMPGILDSGEKLARKDEELRLAGAVFVASSFTKRTLSLCPYELGAVRVIPYGAPMSEPAPPRAESVGKLKVFFAGSLGQRKGLADLLKAVSMLSDRVELTLLGRKTTEGCAPLNDAVSRHRWIPTLSHREVLEEMRRQDVLVLPSLFEGFGLVILEAMAQGTPVITTPHTAGPDIIEDGLDGFIVPIRSPEAIAEKLDLLAADRSFLHHMHLLARKKAELHTWEEYRLKIAAAVAEATRLAS